MKLDWEKIKDNVIHCDTKEKADKLLDVSDFYGWDIRGLENIWDKWYKSKTCFEIQSNPKYVLFSDLDYYKEFEHRTILEFEDIIILDKPKLCEILGIEFNKSYNIKGYDHNPIKVKYSNDNKEILVINKWGVISSKTLIELIEYPELIEKIPEWTDGQKEAFKILKEIFNIKYIIRNKSGMILGCKTRPTKYCDRWEVSGEFINFSGVADNIFGFIKYESEAFELSTV